MVKKRTDPEALVASCYEAENGWDRLEEARRWACTGYKQKQILGREQAGRVRGRVSPRRRPRLPGLCPGMG